MQFAVPTDVAFGAMSAAPCVFLLFAPVDNLTSASTATTYRIADIKHTITRRDHGHVEILVQINSTSRHTEFNHDFECHGINLTGGKPQMTLNMSCFVAQHTDVPYCEIETSKHARVHTLHV